MGRTPSRLGTAADPAYDARYVLHRAEHAARRAFPAGAVHRVPVRTGPLPLRLFARLAIERTPA